MCFRPSTVNSTNNQSLDNLLNDTNDLKNNNITDPYNSSYIPQNTEIKIDQHKIL